MRRLGEWEPYGNRCESSAFMISATRIVIMALWGRYALMKPYHTIAALLRIEILIMHQIITLQGHVLSRVKSENRK